MTKYGDQYWEINLSINLIQYIHSPPPPNSYRCRAEFCTLSDYASPSIGRFRCGGGVRIMGGVGIRQSDSEGMHNLTGVQIST